MKASDFTCMVCGASEARVWLEQCPDDYLGKGLPVDYVRCGACGLVQQHPLPADTSALYADYPVHASRNTVQRIARKIFQRQVYFRPDGDVSRLSLLDYGCGDGSFLRDARQRFGLAAGYEPDGAHAERLSARLGVPVYSSLPALCRERPGRFDVITAHFVLEHVSDLDQAFDAFGKLLKPGGLLHIAVPRIDSWEARLFKKHWHGLDAPRHLVFPAERHFERLAKGCGLEPVRAGSAAFPNTLAASLSAVLLGRFHAAVMMALIVPCWPVSLLAPQGTLLVQMRKVQASGGV